MPIRRNHPFRQKTHQADQKPEERKTFRRKFAPHLPALWLFGALLWCGVFESHSGGLFGIILGLSLYRWWDFSSLVSCRHGCGTFPISYWSR